MKYCCDKFKEFYEKGIEDIVYVPSIKDGFTQVKRCRNCGSKIKEEDLK